MRRTTLSLALVLWLGASALPATAQDATMTSDELLPGVSLTVEEVEPGVLRVVNDGLRDLTAVEAADIVAGYDGGIWLLREDGFLRLGSDGSHAWPTGAGPEDHVFEVAPDGTMWVIPNRGPWYPDMRHGEGLRSADGDEWTVQRCPSSCVGVTVAPDGKVWASWRDEAYRWRVGHLGPTGWEPLAGSIPDDGFATGMDRIFLTDAGDLYGASIGWANPVYRYEDGGWERISYAYMLVSVGRNGTGWWDGIDEDDLVRFSRGEQTGWTPADLPDIEFGFGLDYEFRTAPDGSLWFSLWRSVSGVEAPEEDISQGDTSVWGRLMSAIEDGRLVCDGLAHFDGVTLDRFLAGRCISMDTAADGSVWVLADEEEALAPREGGFPDDRTWGLYVITPEAAAASG